MARVHHPNQLASPNQHDQIARNVEVLRLSEFSGLLNDAYRTALHLEPRLRDMEILPLPEDSKAFAQARPAWSNRSGHHQVLIRVGPVDPVLEQFERLLQQVPGSRKLHADMLGVKPSEVTPQLLFATAFLHEQGHVDEYLDYEKVPNVLRARNAKERAAMPAGTIGVSKLLAMDGDTRRKVEDELQGHASYIGARSFHGLVTKQHAAYRNLSSERHADMFAADAFAVNPTLLHALTEPSYERHRTPIPRQPGN